MQATLLVVMETFELKRDGHTYEMTAENLTTTNIGLAFGLEPKTVWLKEAIGSRCYFPVGEAFNNTSEFGYTLLVKGTAPVADKKSSISLSAMDSPAGPSSSTSPSYKGLGGQRNCTIKVVQAEKNITPTGKLEFISIDKMYIDLTPSIANIDYVQSEVQSNWGEEYVVVSNDGLKISDSAATRGIRFWKVGSRKLFAVRDKGKGKKRKRAANDLDSEDDKLGHARVIKKLDIISAKISQVFEVNTHLPLPLGFSTVAYETFKCSICLASPISPPAIFGRCCKRIIGCQRCIDEWYSGNDRMTKRCPLCQGERGYVDTMILLGIEEFLSALGDISSGSRQAPVISNSSPRVPRPPDEIPSDLSDN